MKLILILFISTSGLAPADIERSLGFSPDKKYEIILKSGDENDQESHGYIKDVKTGKLTETDIGSDTPTRTTSYELTWKGSFTFGVTLEGRKAAEPFFVYILTSQGWKQIDTHRENCRTNILGRQGVVRGFKYQDSFGGFRENNQFRIWCYVLPDPIEKEEAKKITDWTPSSSTEWVITIQYDVDGGSQVVDIQVMTPPSPAPAGETK